MNIEGERVCNFIFLQNFKDFLIKNLNFDKKYK